MAPYPPPEFADRPAREWPIPWMDKESGWKGTAYSPEMGRLIVARIAEGETVKAITADPRMPAYCTVFRWMQMVSEFGAEVRAVRVRMAEARRAERTRPVTRKGGRRSTYTLAAERRILDGIRQGASLSEIVAEPGAPSFKAIYRWLQRRPDFQARFIDACRRRDAHLMVQAHLVIDEAEAPGLREAAALIRMLEGRRGRLTPRLYR